MSDPIEFGKELARLVRDALAPVQRQVAALEARAPEKGDRGADADPALVAKMVEEAMAALPPPKDGKDADPVSDEQVAAQVARHLEHHPPRDGLDAEPLDVDAVADAVVAKLLSSDRLQTLIDLATTEAVAKHFEANPVSHGKDADPAAIDKAVAAAVAALPAPKDGRDADPVSDEQIGVQVAKHLAAHPPKDGSDGVGLAGAIIDRGGHLVITTTKGEAIKLDKVVGKDGLDGLSFESAAGHYDAERGFVITLAAGERRNELVLPYMVHRGFWREGLGTKAGQSITHDGALWIAKRDNASRPCLENEQDWALAARKGRDGKDGKSVRVPVEPVKLGAGNG
ncbi:hypothetical protein HEP73_02169 [Xanthomonas sp. GW]|uniref:hypothetical protein n=1 Tax=Xanthomonas sp. GW TaxID=2724121 RepID=UPI001639F746|nr:hypothetical protein [Xanthomonas sp. GW]QNH21255.1 hypothetical protein HEP73_02169 [Xanthomonas sp. GW]